ncbi:MAG: DUF4834 family protein [Prevotella sp.]|nr:DUF4834 family protein [Prevotella sp.]
MLKGLLFLIVLAFVIVAIIVLVVVNFVLSLIRRMRHHVDDMDDIVYDNNMKRHSAQYNFRGRTNRGFNNTRTHTSRSRSESGETIVDTRDPMTANRKIISDDEGEYVDFVEEA